MRKLPFHGTVLILGLLSGLTGVTPAQTQTTPRVRADQSHAWFMYFGDHPLKGPWSLHMEAQWRRAALGAKPQQLLLRTGLTRKWGTSLSTTLGYGFVETYPYGAFPVPATFPEHRLWQQVQWRQKQGRLEWTNRLRLEQRWSDLPRLVDDPDDPVAYSWAYTNRARVLNRVAIPLRGKDVQAGRLYLAVYDELMVNFGRKVAANVFDQNRAYLALGYQIPKAGRLELGYMLQTVFRPNGFQVEQNHTLQVGFTHSLALMQSG